MLSQQLWLSPSVHPVYARLICAELRRRGFTTEQIIADTRLSWDTLHHNNRFLSFDQMHRLALHALELSQCPWLGIEVGQHTDVSAHGTAGYASIAAPNVGLAIATLHRYSSLRQNIAVFEIESGTTSALVLDEKLILPALREYLLGHFTTAMLRLLETATGLPLYDQITLHWPMPETPWSEAYTHIAARVVFNSQQLRIELPDDYFQTPCLAADPDAERLALRDCENQLQRLLRGGSLSERIKQRLLACQEGYPTLEQMAREEHMAPRTLIRHLNDEGVRYQTLLDDVRCDLACWLLAQTEMSIEAVAERLGYLDPTNFSRTFRRWLGVTPRGFRQQARVRSGEFDATPSPHL
ncbi:AraC family transcriptional regulator ligand-binding domain-containing protein [Pseudomonas sp. NyZ704]|nr:AraC family transcriptional regulator ligand-binding domain-containing protein [Pseudomonas sp. NyZ704]